MKKHGCDWSGSVTSVENHSKECIFLKLKPFLIQSEQRMIDMKGQLNRHEERIYTRPEFNQDTDQVTEEI